MGEIDIQRFLRDLFAAHCQNDTRRKAPQRAAICPENLLNFPLSKVETIKKEENSLKNVEKAKSGASNKKTGIPPPGDAPQCAANGFLDRPPAADRLVLYIGRQSGDRAWSRRALDPRFWELN